MKSWSWTSTWKYPTRKRYLMYSTGGESSGSQNLIFDLIVLSCFGVFCRRSIRKQMILANTLFKCVCYHPEEYQLITSGTDRRVSKTPGILLAVILEHKVWLQTFQTARITQGLGKTRPCNLGEASHTSRGLWRSSHTLIEVCVAGQHWNLCAVYVQLSSHLWSAL